MSGILTALVALLAVCLLSVEWVAWRRPVIFKLGVRISAAQGASIIVWSAWLSTLIISAALAAATRFTTRPPPVYNSLGNVDQVLVYSPDGKGDASTSQSKHRCKRLGHGRDRARR